MCGADQYSTEGAVYCEDCPEGTGDVAPGEGTSVDDCRSEGIILVSRNYFQIVKHVLGIHFQMLKFPRTCAKKTPAGQASRGRWKPNRAGRKSLFRLRGQTPLLVHRL